MKLTERQKKHLRGLAHDLSPVAWLGNAGVTESWLAELDQALHHHELLKVRIAAGGRDERDAAIQDIVERSGAALLSRIGHVAVLYRPRPDKRKIELPP